MRNPRTSLKLNNFYFIAFNHLQEIEKEEVWYLTVEQIDTPYDGRLQFLIHAFLVSGDILYSG